MELGGGLSPESHIVGTFMHPSKWTAYFNQNVCYICLLWLCCHQSPKGGDCKENGPHAIWLNKFWCLMINITCGLMRLLVFMFVVHRMLK